MAGQHRWLRERREKVYARDLPSGRTTLVSARVLGGTGPTATGAGSLSPVVSRDGAVVVYTTTATDLVPGVPPGSVQVVATRLR